MALRLPPLTSEDYREPAPSEHPHGPSSPPARYWLARLRRAWDRPPKSPTTLPLAAPAQARLCCSRPVCRSPESGERPASAPTSVEVCLGWEPHRLVAARPPHWSLK